MTAFNIPLISEAQVFTVQLAGTIYSFSIVWNTAASCWCFDLTNHETTTKLLSGIPLLPGEDLLAQFKHLEIGGTLVLQVEDPNNAVPQYEELGINNRLIFTTP